MLQPLIGEESQLFPCSMLNLKDLSGLATDGVQRMCGTHSIDLFPCTCHAYVVLCIDDSDESQLLVCTLYFVSCSVFVSLCLCSNCLYLPLTSLLQTHAQTDKHTHRPACFHQIITTVGALWSFLSVFFFINCQIRLHLVVCRTWYWWKYITHKKTKHLHFAVLKQKHYT